MANKPNIPQAIGDELSTTISGAITASALSLTLNDATGWSATGGHAIIDEGVDGKEEVIYIESISGSVATISTDGRGLSGTTGVSHDDGAVITDIIVSDVPNGIRTAYLVEHDDDGKHTQIDAGIVLSGNDATSSNKVLDVHADNMAGGTAVSSTNKVLDESWDGWNREQSSLAYGSADADTFTLTITGVDKTAIYTKGTRVKLTQSTGGTKHFVVSKDATFSTDTTVTLYGGSDYNLENEAITSPYWSKEKAPKGFPLDPSKWDITTTDTASRSQGSAANGTYYNLGSISHVIQIGDWETSFQVYSRADGGAGSTNIAISSALSTANNSASDKELQAYIFGLPQYCGGSISRSKVHTVTTKTTYYLVSNVVFSAGAETLYNLNNFSTLVIRSRCLLI